MVASGPTGDKDARCDEPAAAHTQELLRHASVDKSDRYASTQLGGVASPKLERLLSATGLDPAALLHRFQGEQADLVRVEQVRQVGVLLQTFASCRLT